MQAPENRECGKDGICSFRFNYKKKVWKCRRCGQEEPLEYKLTDELLSFLKLNSGGRWFVDPTGARSAIDQSEGKQIAIVNYFGSGKPEVNIVGREHQANALLIATAPLLLQEVIKLRGEVIKPERRAVRKKKR